jgi:hypothetical protein
MQWPRDGLGKHVPVSKQLQQFDYNNGKRGFICGPWWDVISSTVWSNENHTRQVEAKVQALVESIDNSPFRRLRPCDIQKLINTLKLRKAPGIDGIPNEYLRHLPRRTLVHLTHLFNHCLRLSHIPNPWKEAKVITLPKPGKVPKLPQNLCPIILLSTTGKLL